jgi:NADPH:quinone reductase-like Zn-dependent oxidoreductase
LRREEIMPGIRRDVTVGRANSHVRIVRRRWHAAQEVIDYRAVRFEDAVNSVDAVIDLVGGEVQARSFAVLRPGGTLVSAVSKPDQEAAKRHGVRALFFLVNVTTAHLTQIAAMVDAGDLAVNVGTILPLADARVAHEMLEGLRSGRRGKIVLSVGG